MSTPLEENSFLAAPFEEKPIQCLCMSKGDSPTQSRTHVSLVRRPERGITLKSVCVQYLEGAWLFLVSGGEEP